MGVRAQMHDVVVGLVDTQGVDYRGNGSKATEDLLVGVTGVCSRVLCAQEELAGGRVDSVAADDYKENPLASPLHNTTQFMRHKTDQGRPQPGYHQQTAV
jgi:hypothetical protein